MLFVCARQTRARHLWGLFESSGDIPYVNSYRNQFFLSLFSLSPAFQIWHLGSSMSGQVSERHVYQRADRETRHDVDVSEPFLGGRPSMVEQAGRGGRSF